MAQTGYTPILIYSSSTTTNAPAVGNLTNSTLGSELAINITDGKLFYKDNANAIQVIGWKVRPATAGGTGLTSFAVGDLLYADTTTTLAKLADVATGNALISGGVGVAPSWGKIGLTTHVSGILPLANGGTNNTTGAATAVTSNSTSGLMQITGPAAASTRVMTIPDANFTAARTDAGQTFTGTQAFAGITATNVTSSASTVVNAGATTGASGTFNAGTGTVALTGANSRGIGALFNANRNTNTTLPYGGSYEVFGLLSVSNMGTGAGYTTYGLAGYAESDGSPIGVRADAKSTSASSPAYGLYVGSVTGATNNYGIYVADTAAQNYLAGNLSFANGKGIDFSATPGTGTSELFADYEEGTWTPSLRPSSSGTITMNGTYTSGKYTKIGRVVVCTASFYVSSVSSPSGNLYIDGLPYTVGAPSSAGSIWCVGLTSSANNMLVLRIDNSSTSVLVQAYASGTTTAAAPYVQAATEMNVTLTYFV